MQPTIVVGDVHGCADELAQLLERCGARPGDRVVLAGDLVAKGPDSRGVLALARAWGALAVLGNHDAHVLRLRSAHKGLAPGEAPPRAKPEHQRVVESLGPEDWAYLEALPLFLRLGPERPGEADTVVLHAGAVPGVPIERQEREHLLTLRSIREEDGKPTKRLVPRPWAELWRGPDRIVFGHDALRGRQEQAFATGLDTGCVYGGALTALILPERRFVSVPARRAWVDLRG